jgi:hypothetical protein
MAIEYPLVNGERHEFAAIEVEIDTPDGPKRFKGFKAVNYSMALEPGQIRGTSARKLGRTRGEATEEGSLEMYLAEWNELRDSLGDGYMRKVFDVSVTYGADGVLASTDRLVGCRIKKVDKSHSQGADGLVAKLDLDVMKILENGLDPVGDET